MTGWRRSLGAALLALALVAAQALGLVHRVAHGPQSPGPGPHGAHAGHAGHAGHASHAGYAAHRAHAAHASYAIHAAHTARAAIEAADHTGCEAHGHLHAEASTLFASHEQGGVECRLFDQAAQADGLTAAAWPALPPRVPAPTPTSARAIWLETPAHAYLARGPPALRGAGPQAA